MGEKSRAFLEKNSEAILYKMGEKSRAFLEKNSEAILYKMGEKSRAFLEKKSRAFLEKKSRAFLEKKSRAFLYEMGEKSRAFLICLSFILFSIPRGDDILYKMRKEQVRKKGCTCKEKLCFSFREKEQALKKQ
jgi:hypothetical protein